METLFIEYANTDLENHPEKLMMVLQAAQAFNNDNAPPFQTGPILSPGTAPTVTCQQAISLYNALKEQINSGYIYGFVNGELAECRGVGYPKVIPHGETIPVQTVPHDAEQRRIALAGAFYWALTDSGTCEECRFNQIYKRDRIKGSKRIPCFICDQLMFRSILENIIGRDDFFEAGVGHVEEIIPDVVKKGITSGDLLNVALAGAMDKDSYPLLDRVGKNGLVEFLFVDSSMFVKYEHADQQFSRFILGCVGHSLMAFLTEPKSSRSPQNIELLGRCRICGKFFIAERKGMVNCQNCIGKEPRKQLANRQKNHRKNTRDIAIRKEKIKNITYWKNKGFTEKELSEWSDDDLAFRD